MSRQQNDEFPVESKSTLCDVATTTGYNGLTSFKFVAGACDCYERQRAFNIVTSNLHCPSEVLQHVIIFTHHFSLLLLV